jgi:hypothetical protein
VLNLLDLNTQRNPEMFHRRDVGVKIMKLDKARLDELTREAGLVADA